jgi:hypothetical protein
MSAHDTVEEQELASRLERLAGTTRFDDDALDRIRTRAQAEEAPAPHRFTARRALLAVAAAGLVVAGTTVLLTRDDRDSGRVDIADDEAVDPGPTTTGPDDAEAAPTSVVTTTTAPPGTTTVPGEGAGDPTSGGTDPASPPAGGDPGPGDGGDPSPPTEAEPRWTLRSEHYSVEIIGGPDQLFFRRTDHVGSTPDYGGLPDAYGAYQMSSWAGQAGPQCLLSGGGQVTSPDAPPHWFTYGFVGDGITGVEIVMDGQARVAVHLGAPLEDGFRPWIAERGPGEIDRIEAFGAGGDLVATITEIGGGDDFGYSIDTC